MHYTVMKDESINGLNLKDDGVYVDATLGYAGHSSEILKRLKIGHLYEIAKDQNLTLDEKLEELSDIGENDRIKEIIKKAKNEEIPLILLYESSFFSTTLVDVKDYILDIGFTIEKCLKLDNIYEDFYVFLWIILEIKYIISNQASPIYIDKIKEYKTDVTNIKDLDKDLESKMDSSLLNNINKYYKKEIEIEIKKIKIFPFLMI